jgi:predicted MPP superfamily phosphohydrolase
MKKLLIVIVYALLVAGILFAIHTGLPKYNYILPSFGLLLLLDLYLWFFRVLLGILYWLPLGCIAGSIVAGIFVPFEDWNIPFRTYITGIPVVLYVAKLFPLVFLILADIGRILQYLVMNLGHSHRIHFRTFRRWKGLTWTGWILGIVFFLLMAYGMMFSVYNFKVRKQVIVLKELPPAFDGMTIAQISDIHLGSWTCKASLREAIATVDSLHPDVVFVTGDIANFKTSDVMGFTGILYGLHSREGIFAIMGNHDYGDYVNWKDSTAKARNLEELYAIYRQLGWKLLLNRHVILKRGTDSIAVIGVENWGSYKRFQRRADLKKAEEGIDSMRVQLLLAHDPSYWDRIVRKEYPQVDITFAGHTHGFQFGIEGKHFKWSPMEHLYREWAGLYEKENSKDHPQYLYVNRGLGTIGFPGRVGIMPEITLFVLKRSAPSPGE